MYTGLLHISKKPRSENTMHSFISFKKFVDFLIDNIREESSLKAPYFKWILKKFEKQPELLRNAPIENLSAYPEILELVSTCLLPLAVDENTLWALSSPLSPEIFYCTDSLFEKMKMLKNPDKADFELDDLETSKIIRELQYGLVLERVYKLPYLKKTEWIRKHKDPETGLDKYFQLNIDARFIDIKPIGELPEFDCTGLLPSSVWGEEFNKIKNILPLNQFEARGFGIITLNDVTTQQAVEEIGRLIINNTDSDIRSLFGRITHSLQTVAGSKYFQFGIVPFFMINDRSALVYDNFPMSIIIQACWAFELSKQEFSLFRKEFSRNPRTIIWSVNEKENDLPATISEAFRRAGISTYIMFPIFHNEKLIGLFEVGTKKEYPMMSEGQLINLKPALSLISQLIQNMISAFNENIESIIKEKFTSIQPAVQWKFNETAWHYYRDHIMEEKNTPLEDIHFSDLYPLYGAVDIRNSTIQRNQALASDFRIQLRLLADLLSKINSESNPRVLAMLETTKSWQRTLDNPITTQQEIRLNEFLDIEVSNELENILKTTQESKEIITVYFDSCEQETGTVFHNRRLLERSIQSLNSVVNDYFEKSAENLQKIYPCYFDKFRTDGVEYDIYVGQSITPKIPFERRHLKEMKHWQIDTMVEIVQRTLELIPEFTYPLETTQLLFIHPQTIEITFRKDERRFDVEGSYNIRYHIIKKRIDKVLIRDTNERLTQPRKIALVYFEDRDTDDHLAYIRQLQNAHVLLDDLEVLELESVQGVDGLKALRVGVSI